LIQDRLRGLTNAFAVLGADVGPVTSIATSPNKQPQFLKAAVVAGLNIVVAGGTQAGREQWV